MRKGLVICITFLICVLLCSCFNPYYDSDNDTMDTSALALDALDNAFPEIVEQLNEDQIKEILQDDRCYAIIEEEVVERMIESGELANTEYIDVDQIEDYLSYAYGADRGRDDVANMYPIYGSDIVQGCKTSN